MTAGTGIEHSEFNPSESEPVHLYQIWLFPDAGGSCRVTTSAPFRLRTPGQAAIGGFSRWPRRLVENLPGCKDLPHDTCRGRARHAQSGSWRHAWIQVLRGGVQLNGRDLSVSDGAAISEEASLVVSARAVRGHAVRLAMKPPRLSEQAAASGAL